MKRYLFKSILPVIFFSLLVCCCFTVTHAQSMDSLLRVYNSETIHTYGKLYVKGSKQLKFRDLQSEFNSGITKDLYKKATSNLALGNLLTVTSIAALVTSVIIRKNDAAGAIILSTAGIGLNLGSLHFRNRSSQLTGRAIWHRNKEILFGVQ